MLANLKGHLLDDNFFEGVFSTPSWEPPYDVRETEKAFTIRMDVPGIKKEDLKVEIEGDSIHIHGERKEDRKQEKADFIRRETFYGRFSKRFHVPDNVLVEKLEAQKEDGVLSITLPKKEVHEAKVRQVPIKTGKVKSLF